MTDHPSESRGLISAENPCPMCGSSDFTWGIPLASKSVGEIAKVFVYFQYQIDGENAEAPLNARRCNRCGNILLFAIDK